MSVLAATLLVAGPPGQAAAPAPTPAPIAVTPGSTSPVPAPRVLPAGMDVVQQYEGHSVCDPVAKPGILKLQALLTATYGPHTFHSTRACAADPSSEHTEGRALDWMVSNRVPAQKAEADAFLSWLLAPDEQGVPGAIARRMGIMYIIWNNQFWRSYAPMGWGELNGCSANKLKPKNYDTSCHRNHVHFSMTWDGAAALTSYWDGTAQSTDACPSSRRGGRVGKEPAQLTQVDLPEANILDTRTGQGNNKRVCRLQQDRWSGDGHRLDVKVAGKGRIPTVGAYRAILRITAVDPNAPMGIFVWPTGTKRPSVPSFTATMNTTAATDVQVRIGAGGFVSIANSTGDTNITATVVGYHRLT